MPKLIYAETGVCRWRYLGHDALGFIFALAKQRGYSQDEIGELYMRREADGIHFNFKVYEHEQRKDEHDSGGSAVTG